MAKIQTLKINGEVVYPRTIKQAIVDLQGTPTIITNDGSGGASVAITLTENGSYQRTFRIDMTAEYTGGSNEQRIGSLIIECWDEGDDIAHGYYYGDDMSDILTEVAVYQDDIDPDTFYLMLTRDIILNSVTFAITPTDGGEVDAIITNAADDHTKVDDANISPVGSGGGLDDFRLIASVDCSTLGAGDSITIIDSNGYSEIVCVWDSLKGSTATASGFQITEYNDLSFYYQQCIVYSANNSANGLSGWTRIWYDGFLWYNRSSGAATPGNYAPASVNSPYNVYRDSFGHGKIKKLTLTSNTTYPISSGQILIYGR